MPLATTAIGAFPKPDYVPLPDWFHGPATTGPDATIATTGMIPTGDLDQAVERGIRETVLAQVAAGVDIPTDGEIRRENYIHYHCRHLDGIDFERLTDRSVRNGTWRARVPTFVGPITAGDTFLDKDYRIAQSATQRPVKMTVPGPLTIMDSTANEYYADDLAWGRALAEAVNVEVRALAGAGCTHIQIDEPVFARYPDRAKAYGFELLEMVFEGLDPTVNRTLHICCGYPDVIDNPGFPKADPKAYQLIAELVERSSVDALSIEDAHRPNERPLFDTLASTTVVLGCVQIASSRVESGDEIARRVEEVLAWTPAERLVLAPDCGLGLLPAATAIAKLKQIRAAADRF